MDRSGASRHADADERRVAEALRAQAAFTARVTAPATVVPAATTYAGPSGSRAARAPVQEQTSSGDPRPAGSTTRGPGLPARSRDLLPMDVAQLRRALLVALLAGLLLGCLLATLSVLDPGLLPALG
jgi:hypothetical protein